jgi:phospholipase C
MPFRFSDVVAALAAAALSALLVGCGPSDLPPWVIGADDAGASDAGPPTWDASACAPGPALPADPLLDARTACTFGAGATAAETLGVDESARLAIPLTHVIVVMQENRSFDHLLGRLSQTTQPDAEPVPATWSSPAPDGTPVAPFALASTCLEADPPHQWDAMHAAWNGGAMDGFVRVAAVNGSNGRYAMGAYDETDLPYYYWRAGQFAIADHYFASVLSGTWANRDYLYAGSSYGVTDTDSRTLPTVPTLFDALDARGVTWGAYSDGDPRMACLGWDRAHAGVHPFTEFLRDLAAGTLPRVTFVDPAGTQDEHPPNDVQPGEAWSRRIDTAAFRSPLWPTLAIFHTYDEAGGLGDHLPPPAACLASPDQAEFDRLGVRVPLVVISPWARPHYVAHATYEHASILRFIELLHGLPALTARDANASVPLELFDFSACPPPSLDVALAAIPASGTGGCAP